MNERYTRSGNIITLPLSFSQLGPDLFVDGETWYFQLLI